jgi:hypothetical protein
MCILLNISKHDPDQKCFQDLLKKATLKLVGYYLSSEKAIQLYSH